MGFTSVDDFITEMSGGKTYRIDWYKQQVALGVVGRWYDLTQGVGYPGANSWGERVLNGDFATGSVYWTLDTDVTWNTSGYISKAVGVGARTMTQSIQMTVGRTYTTVYTVGGYSGSGNIALSLGTTAGTNRTGNGTYTENITCAANTTLTISFDATVGCTIDSVSVYEALEFMPYSDTNIGAMWHGGNVSTDTKHITNLSVLTTSTTGFPCTLMVVDILGCYPKINLASSTTQTLTNVATLPRYTDGVGVRAFLSVTTAPTTTSPNFVMSYTNTTPTSGRSLGTTTVLNASAVASTLIHSGTAAGNVGPFLPLAAGDTGIVSVESVQLLTAMAGSGVAALVLCRPLCSIPIMAQYVQSERDLLTQLPSLPRVRDGAYLGLLLFAGAATAATSGFYGSIDLAWG